MFITFEGIEGSGKTTQIQKLALFFENAGYQVVVTREPGDTVIGREIRSILLNPKNKNMSYLCELFLYIADRAQHLYEVIEPGLKAGKIVLCDRFIDSTIVYQGKARGLDSELIDKIHSIGLGGFEKFKPDLTILFDLDPATGLKRTFKALKDGCRPGDEARFEQEDLDFHEKVRQGYLELASREKNRFLVVDASAALDRVFQDIVDGIDKRFPHISLR